MEKYLNMEIKRDRSDYPTGLKHYNKDTIAENSLFDIELMKYKAVGIVKGQDNEKSDAGYKAESGEAPEEVRRRVSLRGVHEDGSTETHHGESRECEGRDIAPAEREREEHQAGGKGSDEA